MRPADEFTRRRRLLVFGLLFGACFDPLYEDGDPLSRGYVVCCPDGVPTTCFCPEAAACGASTRIYACGAHRCSSTPFCAMVSEDAGAPGSGTGGGSGTFLDGGAGADAGSGTGGAGGTGGGSGVGGGGGQDAGAVPAADSYEFCCVSGEVTTCACPGGVCSAGPFTPCRDGTCIEGTSSGTCR